MLLCGSPWAEEGGACKTTLRSLEVEGIKLEERPLCLDFITSSPLRFISVWLCSHRPQGTFYKNPALSSSSVFTDSHSYTRHKVQYQTTKMKFTALLTVALTGFASAHTWVESVTITGGKNPQPGQVGERRGASMSHFLRVFLRKTNNTLDLMKERVDVDIQGKAESLALPVCRSSQQNPISTDKRLKAYAGNIVQGTYTENGHVTKIGPPHDDRITAGQIYWFGTTNPETSKMPIAEIIKWNEEGTGGNGKGRLITVTAYDDGLCAEPNETALSAERHKAANVPQSEMIPCRSQFGVPKDVKPGLYHIYWVWDFSKPNKPGHVEWYTSCLDLEIVEGNAFDKRDVPDGLLRSATFRGRL